MTRTAALCLAALALAPLAARARADETPAAPEAAPRIVFETKQRSFGKAVNGEVVTERFRFRNEGKAELLIRRVKPACHCTAALLTGAVVPPGGEGTIEVRFDTQGRVGHQSTRIVVTTNDPGERDEGSFTTILTVAGEVVNLFQVLPPSAYFGAVRQKATEAREVRILPLDKEPVRLVSAEANAPYLDVSTTPYRRGQAEGLTVRVGLRPGAPIGRLEAEVILTLEHAKQKQLRVPVLGMVTGDIVAFPDRLRLEPRPGEPIEGTIGLRRAFGEPKPLVVRKLEGPDFVELKVETVIPGLHSEVQVALKEGLPPGPYAGTIRIHLDDLELPLFEVPLTAVIAPQVRVEPLALLFTAEDAETQGSRTLYVSLPEGRTLKGVAVEGAGKDAFSIRRVDGPGRIEVVPAAGLDEATLVITTDVPGEERVEVPLSRRGP